MTPPDDLDPARALAERIIGMLADHEGSPINSAPGCPAIVALAEKDRCPKCRIGTVLETTPGYYCSRRYDGCDWESA